MAFTDELTIRAKAGDGGDGVVRWRKNKVTQLGGPSGGDGGRGGSVYALGVRDVYLLSKYKNKKEFAAERGEDGQNNSLYGVHGKDLDIELPIGSVITNTDTGEKYSLSEEGERILILKGGYGGRGNESYKSSTNRSPEQSTPGKKGEATTLFIEVELIADIGLIGLPNAGKTSLLNEMTNAKSKVGSYAFTTLEPNLGEAHGFIISDIPGLIEGAATGKGLGHKFLKHIRRTKVLVHLVSIENEDLTAAYQTVRKELEAFDPTLTEKKEMVVVTKIDTLDDPGMLGERIAELEKTIPVTAAITVYDDEQIKELRDQLVREVTSENSENVA